MRRRRLWLSLLLAILAAGCGVDPDERSMVRGTVHYRGQRLTSGTVVFVPDLERGTPNELAIGQIKADGSYQLENDAGLGIAPGWYRVTIVAGHRPQATLRLALPDKYRDPARSGLERQVRPGQENVIHFELQ